MIDFCAILPRPEKARLAAASWSVALSLIFSAESNKKALYVGTSILAILMTAVPYKAPPSINTSPTPNDADPAVKIGWWDRLVIPPQVLAQSRPASPHTYPGDVHLQTDDRKPVTSATFILIDTNSGQILGRSRAQSGDFTFYAPNRPCILRVQVDGYSIAERRLGRASRTFTISLTSSGVPLALQRIFGR